MRTAALALSLALSALALTVVSTAPGASPASLARTCAPGYVHASLSWGEKCLRAGEFCKVGSAEYHAYGFDCPTGHLVSRSGATRRHSSPPTTAVGLDVGRTVLLARRTKRAGCALGPNPDRRCSPGAYYSKLTKPVLCSAGFTTKAIRNVPESVKFAVEREYGLEPGRYGQSLEIDHIVSLELGGSNDIANLFPEKLYAQPGYRIKDKLENKLHDLVCSGRMLLRVAQREIAFNWQKLYEQVYAEAASG